MQRFLEPNKTGNFGFFPIFALLCLVNIYSWGADLLAESTSSYPGFRMGGNTQVFQTRFLSREDSQRSSGWAEWESGNFSTLLEKRGEKTLGSARFQNDYFALSGGNRYKTIPGFFFGRDEDYYSTLTKHQPLEESAFFNLLPGYLSPGMFWMEKYTGDKPGYSLVFPEKVLSITYSPETKIQSLYTNFWKKKIGKSNLFATLQGEAIGTREDYFGRFFLRLEDKQSLYKWTARVYKDDEGKLFENRDDFLEERGENREGETPIVSWSSLSYNHFHKWEIFDSVEPGIRRSFLGIRLGIWDFGWVNPGIRYREYREKREYEGNGIATTHRVISREIVRSGSILLMGKGKKWDYLLGREFRNNGDLLTEGGLNWRGNGWNITSTILFQKEGNLFLTPVERFTGMDRPNIALTDRKTVFRLRFRSKFLDWNITASDRMGRRGSLFFMNLQFLYEF